MAKPISFSEMIEVPQQVTDQISRFINDNVELKMLPGFLFHKKDMEYTTEAAICVDDTHYLVMKKANSSSRCIGYFSGAKPDKKTKRKIVGIAKDKLF